eukprot:scaffold7968_cov240-Ochromonas_danica.AAC.8
MAHRNALPGTRQDDEKRWMVYFSNFWKMTSTITKDPSEGEKQENIVVSPSDEKDKPNRASFSQTFSNADQYDYLLMFLGTAGALTVGCSTPVSNVVFGKMLDALNKNPDTFSDK